MANESSWNWKEVIKMETWGNYEGWKNMEQAKVQVNRISFSSWIF